MSSDTAICNRALIKAGSRGKISSLLDNSADATMCNLIYDANRRSLLRRHTWAFATKRAVLLADTNPPEFEFDNQFILPSDFLRLMTVCNYTSPWKLENSNSGTKRLLSNDAQINLKYVANITDATQFDPLFEECLVLKMASEICAKLNEKDPRVEKLIADFERMIKEARQIDAMESYPDQFLDDEWNTSRLIRNLNPWQQ